MAKITVKTNEKGIPFKVLNATNGAPWHKRGTTGVRDNAEAFRKARIPYARNHDSAIHGVYGGPFSHDIARIFPNFDADPYNPESYDFACTDDAILSALDAGVETFFRLGETIEHQVKKHNTLPPKDFNKWAVICEHIIKHYNEGWADGFNLNIKYWEIWNEPDLEPDDAVNKPTWGGTRLQFFDLYEIAAKHLKKCFPNYKIGGPAMAWREEWTEHFLSEMKKRGVEIDFLSWHWYFTDPKFVRYDSRKVQALLDKHGYGDAENIFNEWNYIKEWSGPLYAYSHKIRRELKGASFVLGTMCEAHDSPIDMLMYYDTRPSLYNGVFDWYTAEPLKPYYPFYWYGMFYDMAYSLPVEIDDADDNVYAMSGIDKDGKTLTVLTYYNDDEASAPKQISLDFGRDGKYEIYKLDNNFDGELVDTTDKPDFTLNVYECLLIKEI